MSPLPLRPTDPPVAYLASSAWIDADHPDVAALATALARGASDDEEIARRCFEWVRDEVLHSADHARGPVTCRASDALRHRTGFCFAKSHLLAALLRANGIPAGLAYQRLALDDAGARFGLHGLVAVHLPVHGWVRADPRGNKPGVDARFEPPLERLAFVATAPGERDGLRVHAAPLPEVVACLEGSATWQGVVAALPDVDEV